MPELPEVEIARRALHRWATGRRIVAVRADDPAAIRTRLSTKPSDALPGGPEALARALVGRIAEAPLRVGKRLGWAFAASDTALLLHLGMSGKWVRRRGDDAPRHGRLGLEVEGGQTLWFVDPRRFGGVAPVARAGLLDALGAGLGPDALEAPLDAVGLRERLAGTRAIKVALLDQAAIAGLGNIHAAEALWRAGIHPEAPGRALAPSDWERLATAITTQLRAVLDGAGDDELTYVTEGGDGSIFAVYGHEGGACPRCAGVIDKVTQSGRSTFFCSTCQAAPRRDTWAARSSR